MLWVKLQQQLLVTSMENKFWTVDWVSLLRALIEHGEIVSPHGVETLEFLGMSVSADMKYPVLMEEGRKLSYSFMAAEAYWILTGDSLVDNIAPYNKNISQFSDNGFTFFGAYGPKIVSQVDYVVNKLLSDPDSRQAVLTIWRENPPPTRDVPCTVAMSFLIRDGKLHCHTFMRSSDVWLGLPYDVFNFSMVAAYVCAALNEQQEEKITLGRLKVTAASMHLYTSNLAAATKLLRDLGQPRSYECAELPPELYHNRRSLLEYLRTLRDSKPGSVLRWWEK